ncbi:SigE family RNA polymerase sigma factor [Phytohabitans houttuyneae]|jgi:RNA polymerase sigma-70 factor (ECF subfamily)|uniref:RNA polymerase sigma24 factor n=1 Tax=Phytohabitans houttuyneae TaxID=1076126 RepID=A0A6V8KHD0_9ACTN|nr:SigE family RNA polymerase sigma factor [Phytohabitans houttuyneae]GFJ81808.1 RNA polymerase sigma24 factor [Phytohabitans houttuyneae]
MRDADGFDEFYRATSARMLRYGFALTGDLPEAQDLVQEAYIRAWQRWRRLAEYDNTEAWVRLVLTRLATDSWRGLRNRRVALRRAGPPGDAPAPSEDTVLLVSALRRLPAAQRRAVALHYLCDMSVAEIAVETGSSTGTVKSWLSRGRTGLAAVLDDLMTEANDVA